MEMIPNKKLRNQENLTSKTKLLKLKLSKVKSRGTRKKRK
jgi:hypothetical protein